MEELKILITGDFYGGNRADRLIRDGLYLAIFNDFLPLIQESDISVTNLESALTDFAIPCFKTGPAIKASPKTIEALKFAGFNLLTLANNHIMDYGVKGLYDTMELCKKNNIDFCGVGKDLQDAKQVFYKKVRNTKLAFINIAENEFSTTTGEEPGANPLNSITNFYSIQEAKRNADYVFVIVHGGHEKYNLPSPRMKQTYRFFIDSGANAVIGHHTHCYSGYELYNGGYIFYSLGNFLFDHASYRNSQWNFGYAVRFIVTPKQLNYDIIPYEQSNYEHGIRVLDEAKKDSFLTSLANLNKVISDDKLLSEEFSLFVQKSSLWYNGFLEPYSSTFLHFLRRRGYIPSFLGKKKRLLLWNLIRCESHREVILKILEK